MQTNSFINNTCLNIKHFIFNNHSLKFKVLVYLMIIYIVAMVIKLNWNDFKIKASIYNYPPKYENSFKFSIQQSNIKKCFPSNYTLTKEPNYPIIYADSNDSIKNINNTGNTFK